MVSSLWWLHSRFWILFYAWTVSEKEGLGFGVSNGLVMHEFEELLARLLGVAIRNIPLKTWDDGQIIRLRESKRQWREVKSTRYGWLWACLNEIWSHGKWDCTQIDAAAEVITSAVADRDSTAASCWRNRRHSGLFRWGRPAPAGFSALPGCRVHSSSQNPFHYLIWDGSEFEDELQKTLAEANALRPAESTVRHALTIRLIRKEKDAGNAKCGDYSGIPWVLMGGCPTSLHREEEDT